MFGIKMRFYREPKNTPGETPDKFEKSRNSPSKLFSEKLGGQADQDKKRPQTAEVKKPEVFSDIRTDGTDKTDMIKKTNSAAGVGAETNKTDGTEMTDKKFGGAQVELGRVWEAIARWTLYALIFLTPIFFLPWGVSPVAQNKQFLATVLIAVAFIAWLAKSIASGKLVWPKTPINIAVWFLVVVWAISSLLSISKYRSVGLVGLEADSLLNVVKYALAFFLIGAVFNNSPQPPLIPSTSLRASLRGGEKRNDLSRAVYVFLASVAILAVFTGLQFAGVKILPWDFAKTIDFNPIGTINALALFLGAGLALTVGLIIGKSNYSSSAAERSREVLDSSASGRIRSNNKFGIQRFWQIFLYFLAVILVAELVLINFNFVWWPLGVAMIFLAAYFFAWAAQPRIISKELYEAQAVKAASQIQKLVFPLLILGISVLMLLVRTPAFFQFSPEVRPTHQATYEISKDVLKSRGISTDLFGSGPGTFTFDYGLYRGPLDSRNPLERLFWGVRFNQGFSFVSTALATTGALGILALALLIFSFIWQAFRKIGADLHFENNSPQPPLIPSTSLRASLRGGENGGAGILRAAFVSVAIYLFIVWFLYPANFSLLMFTFVFLGLMATTAEPRGTEDAELRGRNLREISLLASPQRTMIISLLLIILMIGSVSLLYVEGQKYAASLYFSSGLKAFNVGRNVDAALTQIGKAINLDPVVDDYQRAASQLFLVKTKTAIDSLQSASAAAAEPLRADFQNNMARAVSFAQEAQTLNPIESANWTNLGYVYENVLLFVEGAEDWMTMAYEKAAALEPQNPALRTDLGRAYLAAADKLQTQMNQLSSAEKPDQAKVDALKQKRGEAIAKAVEALGKAVVVKPDYSPAHLLLAQAYILQGDVKNAIQKSFDYYTLNPSDAGAAFQLGFLFYKDGQLDNAKAALERAVELNDSYSNARYFLGLIHDAQGNKDKAKEQFEKISALNPDNDEVKKILDNLNAGRGAMETIVPPAPPPEQRTKTPVPETGGAARQQPLLP
jgi:Flp pilus assembly protein TadD